MATTKATIIPSATRKTSATITNNKNNKITK